MRMQHLVLLLSLLVLLCSCGGKEYTYSDGRDQKEGPGLLSGEDGVFTLYNKGREGGEQESSATGSHDNNKKTD